MTVAKLKKEIKKRIDDSNNKSVLDTINTILYNTSFEMEIKREMTKNALEAEEDIKQGRLYTKTEFLKKLKSKK